MFAEPGLQAMRTMAFFGAFVPILLFANGLWRNVVLPGKIHLFTVTLGLRFGAKHWRSTGLWMDDHGVMLPPGFA